MSSDSSDSSSLNQLRVVFDTNVYIAAFLRPGLSEELVRRGLRGEFTVISSRFIIKEIERKLLTKSEFSPKHISSLTSMIEREAEIIRPIVLPAPVARDPDDDNILACAHSGKANLIVSLDRDLLALNGWETISILHPKTFSWIVPER